MASNLLLDLNSIDLNGVALSSEEVGRLNPQAGDMRQLDHVIYLDRTDPWTGVGVKHVRADEFWVPGHIPGRPLFPGVLMIEAGAQLSSVLHRIRASEERFLGFTRADDAVFRHQVVPGDTLYLIARQVEFGRRRFVSKTQGVVGDKLVFEVTVTGMAL